MINSLIGSFTTSKGVVNIQTFVGIEFSAFASESTVSYADSLSDGPILIRMIFKETGPEMYAFESEKERMVFDKLLSVPGVGGKTALAILAEGPDEVIVAINNNDEKFFKAKKGVGPKAASQIIISLDGKLTEDKDVIRTAELKSALKRLGFKGKIEIKNEHLQGPIEEAIKALLAEKGRQDKNI